MENGPCNTSVLYFVNFLAFRIFFYKRKFHKTEIIEKPKETGLQTSFNRKIRYGYDLTQMTFALLRHNKDSTIFDNFP